MRIVFMGTPDFAVVPLHKLVAAGHQIAAVFTQPDKPRQRGQQTRPTPVKAAALELGLPVYAPDKLHTPENLALLAECRADVFVVVAYGKLLKPSLFELPPYGTLNIHASLLPAYRGAAPIHRAVLNGETESGVTIMYIDKGLDSGDMLLRQALPIGPEEDTGSLHDRLMELGGELICTALRQIAAGTAQRLPQDPALATFAPLLSKEDEIIDWSRPAQALHDQIRGLSPWPGAYTRWRGKRLKLWRSRIGATCDGAPGTLLAVEQDGLSVACGDRALTLLEMQPEGKARLAAADLARGYHPQPGEVLGKED